MTPDEQLAAYRESVLTLLSDGIGMATLAFSLIILLLATSVVRHW